MIARRPTLVLLLAVGVALLEATAAGGQAPGRRVPRVVMVNLPLDGETAAGFQTLRRGLRELGWIEGQTVALEYRGAGKEDRFPAVAAEAVRSAPDVIVTGGSGAGAAVAKATASIPIVMATATDPVAAGHAVSLARPGKNVTGQLLFAHEMAAKRMEVLKQTLPRVSRVTALWRSSAGSAGYLRETETAARALGVTVDPVEVKATADLPALVERAAKGRAGALVMIQSTFFVGDAVSEQIVQLALRHRLPTFHFEARFADRGGLVSFGPDVRENFRRAAGQVDKILKGARPDDLPFEAPTTFELVVNLRTARALGIEIPTAVRVRATRLVE